MLFHNLKLLHVGNTIHILGANHLQEIFYISLRNSNEFINKKKKNMQYSSFRVIVIFKFSIHALENI